MSSIFETPIHQIDSKPEAHAKYRSAIRRWDREFCATVLIERVGGQSVLRVLGHTLSGRFETAASEHPQQPERTSSGGLRVVGAIILMLDFPSRELIMDSEARDIVGDFFNVKKIVHMMKKSLHNHTIHLSGRGYLPHHLTGADVLANAINRELVNARFESEKFLPRNIPVVVEFLLRVVDE